MNEQNGLDIVPLWTVIFIKFNTTTTTTLLNEFVSFLVEINEQRGGISNRYLYINYFFINQLRIELNVIELLKIKRFFFFDGNETS